MGERRLVTMLTSLSSPSSRPSHTPSSLPRCLSIPLAPLPSPLLSGPPPLCVCLCVFAPLDFFLCRCLSVSACVSLRARLSRLCLFPPLSLQVGWRRKPTTDLSPTTSRISFLPSRAQDRPLQCPSFCILGGGALSPLGPASSSELPPPSPTPRPLAGFSPRPCPAPCLSTLPLFCVCLFLSSSPLPPRPLPGLFFTPRRPLADAVSGSGQLSNISVGREKPCVSCFALLGGVQWGVCGRDSVPCAGTHDWVIHRSPEI